MKLLKVLSRPIVFHRCLAELTGSVTAGLMLSQAVYWTERTGDPDGWFWKTQDDWFEETMLGRKEQETARRRLREVADGQLWIEQLRGIPAKLFYRIDLGILERLLTENQHDRNGHASMPESDILDSPKRAYRHDRNGHTFITEITTEITAENTAESGGLRPLTQPEALTVALEFFPGLPVYHHELITQAQISQISIWRDCCQMWRDNRYSERNVAGLIDSYYRRESQDSRRNNGQNQNRRLSNGERNAIATRRIVAELLSDSQAATGGASGADSTDEGLAVFAGLL